MDICPRLGYEAIKLAAKMQGQKGSLALQRCLVARETLPINSMLYVRRRPCGS